MKEETRIKATSEDVTAWQTENGKDASRQNNMGPWGRCLLTLFPPDSST
jgi:hypothetical protein